MKCILCDSFSLNIICSSCQTNHLKPKLTRHKVGNIEIFSFFNYDDIKPLLHTKYTQIGSSVFKILAKNSFGEFAKEFGYEYKTYAIGIDDNSSEGYAHTAILAQSLKSKNIKVLSGKLLAQNSIKYATKNLDFKLSNPRDFNYTGKEGIDVILVDDVVTDGVTMNEAKKVLKNAGVNVLFGIVLSYSKGR